MSLEQRIAELEARVAEREARLAERETQLAEREAQLAERETQLAERDARVAQLEKLLLQLQQQLEEAKRAGKRQATPFSRKKRKKDPKKPGRKKGQGKFTFRQPPSPEEINETKKEPVSCCPECGGRVGELKEHEHYEVDLPPIIPVITKYITYMAGWLKQKCVGHLLRNLSELKESKKTARLSFLGQFHFFKRLSGARYKENITRITFR